MSFPPYPKYRESGVEWLAEVPEHWEKKPLRNVFKFSKGLNITKEDLRDEGILCVNYGEIHSKYGFQLNPDIHPLRCVPTEFLSTNPEAIVENGEFVFADTSEDIEGSGNFTHVKSDRLIFAGYHTIIARPRKDVCPLFLAFQMHSSVFRAQIQCQVKGIKVFTVSQKILKRNECWLPPYPEQQAIASFLDVETSKIDSLVAEQRRLIELLKEKRQAVISHAVTKGLNPNAPMKPSGIQWLGDVPEHWLFGKLSYATSRIGDGLHGTPMYVDESEFRFVNGNNLSDGVITITDTTRSVSKEEFDTHRVDLNDGSLLMSINGTIGNLALYHGETVMLGKSAAYINCIQTRLDREFLYWFLQSGFMRFYYEYNVTGTTIYNLSLESIRKIPVPLPQLDEQRKIVEYLNGRISEFKSLVCDAERAIDLLQERRTALISAAVTGKIDVRGFAVQGVA